MYLLLSSSGFSGQIQMVYSPSYNNDTHRSTKQTNSCHLMQTPVFDDSFAPTFTTQNGLDISQRALSSGLTGNEETKYNYSTVRINVHSFASIV